MVQVALLDGDPVIAFDLSEEEFEGVRARYRADPSCLVLPDGTPAVPRRTGAVRAHFARKVGFPGVSEPETVHHVRAKRALRDAAVAVGCEAVVEARSQSGAWQADVLVRGAGRVVAFEVQWSAQTVKEYLARSQRYAADGVDVVWLVRRTARAWWQVQGEVECVPLSAEGVMGRAWDSVEIGELLEALVRLCLHPIPVTAPRLRLTTCYRCGWWFVYRDGGQLFGEKEPFTSAQLRWLQGRGAGLAVRYSSVVNREYPAWLCPRCGAMQGDAFLLALERGEEVTVAWGRLVPDWRDWWLARRLERFMDSGLDLGV